MRTLILLAAFALTTPAFANSEIIDLYDGKIEFDVVRDGSVVGEHVATFTEVDGEFKISSRMNIDISVLFIPVYSFRYKTDEVWKDGQLHSIRGNVLDGSDKIDFKGSRTKEGLVIEEGEDRDVLSGSIFATNHWNPDVLKQNQVFNTLTANMNNVTITDKGMETVEVYNGTIQATRYDYSGDLTDTSAWYDENGRWVKLEFLARDGSTISYKCRTCIKTSGLTS